MSTHNLLVSGPTVANDLQLLEDLKTIATVFENKDNHLIESITRARQIDFILLEISSANPFEVEMIKTIKTRRPNIEIILIDGEGDRDMIARAFAYGVKDAFRKPYKRALIVERVKALLKLQHNK